MDDPKYPILLFLLVVIGGNAVVVGFFWAMGQIFGGNR